MSNGVQYSCIAPLHDITNLNVFIGSHLKKRFNNGGQRGQRLYHTIKKRIQLNVGEVIVFDEHLCHCGGDSTVTNPRLFSTFGSTFKTLKKNNYISECVKCSWPEDCFVCSSLGRVKERELFFDDVKRYSTFSLINHGFTIIKVIPWKANIAFNEEIAKLKRWDTIAGINFHDMGQDITRKGK